VATLAITGSTGALGGRVAERLAERGIEQRLIVRDRTRAPRLADAEVAVATSHGSEAEMREALSGIETMYFVSGREDPNRLEQHLTLIRAARDAGVRRIVYVSFLGAAPDATFTLARQHWATEQGVRESGLAFTFLRSSMYLDSMPRYAGPEGVIRGPAGDGAVAPISRDDLAACAVEALTANGRYDGDTYELTGPELLTMTDIAARLSAFTGRTISYEAETIEQAWESRRPTGAPDFEIEGWISSYLAVADGSLAVQTEDVQRLTGHPPDTLEQCLQAHPELLQR
jgi:uncharacterized protein YbjT (DUF2867 family)